jgi:type II secretory pathway pseudopilin PulG
MKGPQLKRMTIVIVVCALVGALAGIAGSAAAPSSSKSASAQKKAAKKAAKKALRRAFRRGPGPGGPGFMGGPVHATAVVPNKDGTDFLTITTDAGTLNSVDGTTVHLKEGTDKKVYKDDVGIDVGGDAKVIRNHQDAKLSDLKEGDHVRVITGGPEGNVVIAEDDAFIAQEKKRFGERGFHHHGFGPGAPGGPPPGPGSYPGDGGGSNQNGSNTGSGGDTTTS